MRLWRSRYAFGSIYAYGVRYRASHSICLLCKRADNQWLPLQANLDIPTKIKTNTVGAGALDCPITSIKNTQVTVL